MAGVLTERLGAVTLSDMTSNVFQPTLQFRGFTASPLLGLPQGVAVYQNGVRINEPFGDTVQFDLIPQFAVDRVQLSAGAEPTYGLNALGGALAFQLKTGFNVDGFRSKVTAGSFSTDLRGPLRLARVGGLGLSTLAAHDSTRSGGAPLQDRVSPKASVTWRIGQVGLMLASASSTRTLSSTGTDRRPSSCWRPIDPQCSRSQTRPIIGWV